MKKAPFTLIFLIVISSVLAACLGAYLKYEVLQPMGLYREESIISVPFLLISDYGTQYTLNYKAEKSEETVPPETVAAELPTEPATEPPTEPETEPPTEPPVIEVDESWFDDVLFIGDSRTVGLRDYARTGNAEYFCSVGMTVLKSRETWAKDTNFPAKTLEQLLSERTYGKIYIELGLNDSGYPVETIMDGYQKLLDMVRELQPDAVIILQGIMAVSKWKSDSSTMLNMDNLNAINEGIKGLSDGEMIRYIDVNEWIANEEGYLPDEMTGDGCHLYVEGYRAWAQWIWDTAGELRIP